MTGASARTGAWCCPAGSSSGITERVEFSPTGPLAESMAVIGKNLQAREA
jgi:hypothetical protein